MVEWLREYTDLSEDAVLPPDEVAKNEPVLRKIAQAIPARIRLEGLKPEERLVGLKPEEIARSLKPEERLAGLAPAQAVLALPDEVLRGLSPEYVATLPADVQATIRRRLMR